MDSFMVSAAQIKMEESTRSVSGLAQLIIRPMHILLPGPGIAIGYTESTHIYKATAQASCTLSSPELSLLFYFLFFFIGYNLNVHNPHTPHSYHTYTRVRIRTHAKKRLGGSLVSSTRETRSTTKRARGRGV